MILLHHPTGNTFSRALLKSLLEADQLGLFATTIAIDERAWWLRFLPAKIRAELLRRKYDAPRDKLFTRPAREYARMIAGRLGLSFLDRHETGIVSFDAIYRDLDQALAERLPELAAERDLCGVYAYEGGALQTFRAAKRLALKCYYDLPIAYWETSQHLLHEEAERWPEWEPTLLGVQDSIAKNKAKTEEISLADVVVCPSQFVLDSIPEALRRGGSCVVAEFGSPIPARPPEFRAPGRKLRVLFAGSMSQRKGLADVFAAMKLLKGADIELIVLGSPIAPMDFYLRQFSEFVYERPRPHQQVLELMETCDALILPSIVEGRALVQQEAMSRGLVLLATANAGGQDLIEDGRAGFLLPIRSPETIAARLEWLDDNRDAIPNMKRAAYEKASALTWKGYTDKILSAITGARSPAPLREPVHAG